MFRQQYFGTTKIKREEIHVRRKRCMIMHQHKLVLEAESLWGKIILNEASIIMESFYPWKDLLPDKGVLSLLKTQWSPKLMKAKSL